MEHRRRDSFEQTVLFQEHLADGVTKGYAHTLEIHGVGFRAALKGKDTLQLQIGFSHDVIHKIPSGVDVKVAGAKQEVIEVSGISSSSQALGASASSSRTLSSSRRARRMRSSALFLAVVVIHAPGLRGTPRSGHTWSATTKASCTASSARSKSPSTRMSDAIARPDSSRNRRSTVSAEALTAPPPPLPGSCAPATPQPRSP